jgi:hypothetical protein
MTDSGVPSTTKKAAPSRKTAKKTESPEPISTLLSVPKKAASPKVPKAVKAPKKSESSAAESDAPSAPKKAPAARKAVRESEGPALVFVSPEERHTMICNAAYYLAERRGFVGGDPFQDWVEAEQQVDRVLGATQA